MAEKYITVADGSGFSKRIRAEDWPKAQAAYKELWEAAQKAVAKGLMNPERAEQYKLRIVKEE